MLPKRRRAAIGSRRVRDKTIERGFHSRNAPPNVGYNEIGLRYKLASALPAISHTCEERQSEGGAAGQGEQISFLLLVQPERHRRE